MSQHKRRIFLKPGRVHLDDSKPWADIDPDNVHHLRHVLRLGPGAKIRIFDGTGREYEAEISDSRPRKMKAKILGTTRPETEPFLRIHLAQAMIKENNFDKLLTSCTELGCASFLPLVTGRTVAGTRKGIDWVNKMKRWEKILELAAAQSGRVRVPEIHAPLYLTELLKQDRPGLKIILSLKTEGADLKRLVAGDEIPGEILVISGPEGGLEDREEKLAIESGCHPVNLGPRILRAETSGIAALALIQYLAGDLDLMKS